MKALFCVVEGIDGSGKTSLIKHIREYIQHSKFFIECSHSASVEPTKNSPYSQNIKTLLEEEKITNQLEMFFLKDRLWNIQHNIKPYLNKKNHILIQDRYYYSTIAYQAKNIEHLTSIYNDYKKMGSQIPDPNIIIYLNISPQNAIQRISKRNTSHNDLFENIKQLERVKQNYMYLWDNYFQKKNNSELFTIDTSSLSETDISEKAFSLIKTKYKSFL